MYHGNRIDRKEYLMMSTEEHEKPLVQMLLIITWKGLWLSEVNTRAGFSVGVTSEAFGAVNVEVLLWLTHTRCRVVRAPLISLLMSVLFFMKLCPLRGELGIGVPVAHFEQLLNTSSLCQRQLKRHQNRGDLSGKELRIKARTLLWLPAP